MGSRFLNSGGTDLTALQDGLFQLNVSSAVIQTLTPSLPVKTSATKELVSGQIQLSDCNFVPLEDLDLGEHAITDISELLLIANGDASTPPEDMLTLYTNNSKLRYTDDTGTEYQVATSTDIGSYLPLAGNTMAGNIDRLKIMNGTR